MTDKLALSGYRVIDLTRVRSGPTAVRHLADWGADIIKVEPPGGDRVAGDRDGSDFQNLHRNKRSVTLNLKSTKGIDLLKRMVETADVVVENFRPDVKDRLGIDYKMLSSINPRLVYASISGYGQDGPYRMRPGLDQIAQGMGGLMSITGEAGNGPVRAGIAIADIGAGLYCALGILTALLEREKSGRGQWVQTSLLQAQIALLDFQAARWTIDKEVPRQAGNHHPTNTPMGTYPTADGHVNIAPLGNAMWLRLCEVLGHPEWAEDARFRDQRSRRAHRDALSETMAKVTTRQSTGYWVEHLNFHEIPCGPIYTIDEVFADAQVLHLGVSEIATHPRLGNIELIAQPIKMTRSESKIRCTAPELGEQNREILLEIGLDPSSIDQLGADGVI